MTGDCRGHGDLGTREKVLSASRNPPVAESGEARVSGEAPVYVQKLEPVADSLGLSALVATLPLVLLLVLLGGVHMKAHRAGPMGLLAASLSPGSCTAAGRPDALQRRPGSRFRLLPHPVDGRQRPVRVPDDRPHQALRRPAPLVRATVRRPAHPGTCRRLLLRRAPGSSHGLRRDGHTGRHTRPSHRPAAGFRRLRSGPSDPAAGPRRAPCARRLVDGRRHQKGPREACR